MPGRRTVADRRFNMKAPAKIYLQVDPEGERPEVLDCLEGVTWCQDKINDNDVEYIRADLAAGTLKECDCDVRGSTVFHKVDCPFYE